MPLYSPTRLSITGNTGGTPLLVGDVIYLSGGANATLNQTSQTIEIVGGAGGAGDGLNRIAAGTQTAGTLATVIFSNSNNVTFGMTNSSIVTASASFNQSVQTQNRFNATLGGNSTSAGAGYIEISSGTLTLAGGNNIVLSQNGNAVTISGSAFPAQTNQTLGIYVTSNTTGESSSSTYDARSLTFRGLGIASVGWSNSSLLISVPAGGGAGDGVNIIAAGTQTANTTGTVVFSNSNNFTFGMSNNSIVTASYTVPVVSNALQDVGTATGSGTNTSRFAADDHVHRGVIGVDVNGIASTFYGTVQLSAGNNISLATGGNSTRGSIQIIDVLSSSAIANAVSSASNAGTLSSRFALADHAHAGLNSISIVGNTSGTTTAGAGSLVLAGGPNITLSASTAAGGMTVSVSGGAGGGGATFSAGMSNLGNTAGSSGTVSGQMVFVGSSGINLSQSTNGASGTITIYSSGKPYFTGNMPIEHVRGAVISINPLDRIVLFSPFIYNYPDAFTLKTVRLYGSRGAGVPLVGALGVGLYSYSNSTKLTLLTSSSQAYSLASSTYWSGIRAYEFSGFSSTSLTPGNYVAALWWSSSNTGSLAMLGAAPISSGTYVGTVWNGTDSTANAANSNQFVPFLGGYTVTSNAMPTTVGLADVAGRSYTANSIGPFFIQFLEINQ